MRDGGEEKGEGEEEEGKESERRSEGSLMGGESEETEECSGRGDMEEEEAVEE